MRQTLNHENEVKPDDDVKGERIYKAIGWGAAALHIQMIVMRGSMCTSKRVNGEWIIKEILD